MIRDDYAATAEPFSTSRHAGRTPPAQEDKKGRIRTPDCCPRGLLKFPAVELDQECELVDPKDIAC
jgi:hypothetical protein